VNANGNTISVNHVTVEEREGRQKLIFKWDGRDQQGQHSYDEDIHINMQVTDSSGESAQTEQYSFGLGQFAPESNPANPTQNQINLAGASGNYSNRTIIIPGMFSLGGLEFSGLTKLFGKANVDFRIGNLFGDMKWGNIDLQVDAIKRQINAFSLTPSDKVTMIAYGQAGVLAKKYLMENTPVDKIAKLVTVSAPIRGVNSIPMATQSYSIVLLFQPVVTLLSDLGLDEMLKQAGEAMGPYGPDLSFLNFLTKISRNDMVISPFNVIGLLLGRQDYAQYFQAGSGIMNELNAWAPEDIGIETASVTTALWPDMPGGIQAVIVAGFAAAGFAGAYTNVTLFDVKSKTYNNLNDEATEIIVSLLEKQMERMAFNPLKEALNEAMRDAEREYIYSIWHDYVESGFKARVLQMLEGIPDPPPQQWEQAGKDALREFIYEQLGFQELLGSSGPDWSSDPGSVGGLLKKQEMFKKLC
jgi:hypothetical protein